MGVVEIDGYEIKISNEDKIFYKEADVTKGDIIDYYNKIFSTIRQHLLDRPLTLHRYPDGIDGEDFYQKEAPDYFPDFIETVEVEKKDGSKQKQIICDKEATLIYLANLGTISFHIWLSKSDRLLYPDKLVFDLDPPSDNFEPVRDAALDLRDLLKNELSVEPYVMTTGSDGLHVALSIKREEKFEIIREITSKIASRLVQRFPDKYTREIRKNKRGGKLFLDLARNAYAQTSVSPYSIRARKECSIATPLNWDEVNDSDVNSRTYTIKNIFRRLGQIEDPWKSFYQRPISIKSFESILRE